MEPTDNPAAIEAPPRRPWGLAIASILASAIGLFRSQGALDALSRSRGAPAPDHPLPLWRALLRSAWEYEQQHRSLSVGVWSATVVLSGLLFFASTRVFLRVRETGSLWRQALATNLVLALVTVRVEQHSAPERLRIFRQVVAESQQRIEPLKGLTLDQCEQLDLALSISASWLLVITLFALLGYAFRMRTRALTG